MFLAKVNQYIDSADECGTPIQEALDEFVGAADSDKVDYGNILNACYMLAQEPIKDMSWPEALRSADRAQIIEALESAVNSLEASILEELSLNHEDYQESVRDGISGRHLLDKRRSSEYKVRGIKQGFKEDKKTADGPGFSYYSHMAKLAIVRIVLFRRNRGNKQLCIKDVCTAFLQSKKFPSHIRKFMKFRNPLTGITKYYRQW